MVRTSDRVVIGVMSLGYLGLSVLMVSLALGWTNSLTYMEGYLAFATNRWILGATGFLVFIISLTLFLGSFRVKPAKETTVHETGLGQVKITMPALEHLISKAAVNVQGVRDVKPMLRLAGETLKVALKVQVSPDVNIPQVSEELQKKVLEHLQNTAGITLKEIKVHVNRVSWDAKGRVE